MAANIDPIFCKIGNIAWSTIDTANTAKDGTGTVVTVFTAAASVGSRLEKLKIRAKGTNTATVLRVWINNGGVNSSASNNTLYTEMTIAATTVSEVAALLDNEIPLNIVLPPGYKINITIGTTVAAGLHVSAVGGDYQ